MNRELCEKYKDTVSEIVHNALVNYFKIPTEDYFHIIDEVNADDLKFPATYLGIKHSQRILYLQIIAAKGRTKGQKAELYGAIAEQISQMTEIKKADVIIVLQEIDGIENWSFGNGEIQEPEHLKRLGL